uniref:AlNc14C223G9162 protein n=1 Tax=Albugo laibachii Nc14 TaxID=890382 RepID=F0WS20_9STRA|nr:AlNc14C223G9162 [Albugo laibachii Nc14]|eukprot:CCA24138.1 AlNc14C223G9162 [Albugo laibachii Nc14]
MFRRIFRRRQLYTPSTDSSRSSLEDDDKEVSQWKLTDEQYDKYRKVKCNEIGDLRAARVLIRRNSQNKISSVRQEEKNAAIAWERLCELCLLYQEIVNEENEKFGGDQGLRTLLQSDDESKVTTRNIENLEKYPDGFTAEMFVNLGTTLHRESLLYDMVADESKMVRSDQKYQKCNIVKRMRVNSI